MISLFDVILIISLSGFVFYGLFFGFIRVIGGIAGVFVGSILASRYYLLAYSYFATYFPGHENSGKIISFIFTFFLIRKLVVLAFAILDKIFHIISIIPFLTTFNRLFGAIVGLTEGTLILGLMLFVSSKYMTAGNWLGNGLISSQVAPWLMRAVDILLPVLPQALKALKGLI
ncbi:MAG: CvpA family protein [Candidatus Falkowbacteria bacterium]|nr:CvpA family protein [Candidatus Falkowbacteria bacterium]